MAAPGPEGGAPAPLCEDGAVSSIEQLCQSPLCHQAQSRFPAVPHMRY